MAILAALPWEKGCKTLFTPGNNLLSKAFDCEQPISVLR